MISYFEILFISNLIFESGTSLNQECITLNTQPIINAPPPHHRHRHHHRWCRRRHRQNKNNHIDIGLL
jgi:hypothetical protein